MNYNGPVKIQQKIKKKENYALDELYVNINNGDDDNLETPFPTNLVGIKLNDLKNVKNINKNNNAVNYGVKYIPDVMAERLVDDILEGKK
jgi:hypothetical protein